MNDISLETRVRVKPIYPVYRVTDRMFRVGAQRGLTVDIDDPHDQMWTLVNLLDGERTLGEVVSQTCQRFPALTTEDVLAGVRHLDRQGLVEDATPTCYETDPGLTRYTGNVNYFSHYARLSGSRADAQDRLRGARCVLFGLGGGGSYILPLLAAAGFGEIIAVDYDHVELTNLNRQLLYAESDIGELKTSVAARAVQRANSTVSIVPVTRKITSARDVAEIVTGADVAICAIDEPPIVAQRRVNAGCVSQGVPYICGGSFVTRGRVFSVVPGESGCFDCLHVYYAKKDPLFTAQLASSMEQDLGDVTIAFAPHIAAVASFITAEAVRLLTRHAPPLSIGTQWELHYETGNWERLWEWDRYPDDCPTCGNGDMIESFAMYDDVMASLQVTPAQP